MNDVIEDAGATYQVLKRRPLNPAFSEDVVLMKKRDRDFVVAKNRKLAGDFWDPVFFMKKQNALETFETYPDRPFLDGDSDE